NRTRSSSRRIELPGAARNRTMVIIESGKLFFNNVVVVYFLATAFLRRSAQRFFIISEIRFRPAALMRPRLRVALYLEVRVRLPAPLEESPSSEAMARLIS